MATDRYASFAELAEHERHRVDYRITVLRRPSSIAVIAPHGGAIEAHTGAIARDIAGTEFSLYLFEGLKRRGNAALHITSHRFGEPSCLALLRGSATVVAVHGCNGNQQRVLLGGLDHALKQRVAESLRNAGLQVDTDGHSFQGADRGNVCNRGRSGGGVQLEISRSLRGSGREPLLMGAVRRVLLTMQLSNRDDW